MMRALVELELRRVWLPFGRSLIPAGLLAVLGFLRDDAGHGLVIAAGAVALALSAMIVPTQVARDRRSGELAYLASLPCSGAVLAGARAIVVTIVVLFSLAILTPALAASGRMPTWISAADAIHLAAGCALNLIALGIVFIALLSRFSLARVIGVPTVAAIVVVQLLDLLHVDLISAATALFTGHGAATLFLLGSAAWVVPLLAFPAFFIAAKQLQPHGGPPSPRASKAIVELSEWRAIGDAGRSEHTPGTSG